MTDSTILNSPPSNDPANDDTFAGMFRNMLGKFLQDVDDMLPAKIVAYDRASNRANVQPLIMVVTTAGNQMARAPIASVPVLQMGGGGCMMNFNLKPGDFGWIKAADRDISLFLQNYQNAAPNTKKKHDFSHGVFIPDIMTGFTINPEDEANAVFQTLDGTCRVSLWPDRVKITAPLIVLDSPSVVITGQVTTDGSRAPGNATFNGTVHATGDMVAGAISVQGHVHGGVQGGSGSTGVPI